MKREGPLAVDIPPDDSSPWARVGVIAAVGFVIGVAWPKLAGVKLGPSAPGEATHAAAAAAMRAPEPPREVALTAAAARASGQATAPAVAPSATPSIGGVVVTVGHGVVVSCKSQEGETLKSGCGSSGFDLVAMPRLKNLAQCAAAAQASGRLSAVFTLDYGSGRMDMSVGRSSTVREPDSFLGCMRTEFTGVALKGLAHEHARYVVAYGVTFDAAKDGEAKPADKEKPGTTPTLAPAVVTWENALVRDAPKTGAVVARLPRGTKVSTTASREGWFKITYADGEGWVYRGAIGR